MGVEISGDNINVPGQVAITGEISSLNHVVTARRAGSFRAYVQSLNLNAAAPIDLTSFTVPFAKYVPVRAIVFDATANLAAATLGLYTASGGGGTAIVAPTLLSNLTGSTKFQSLTIAALTDMVTAQTLYPRLTVASGVAGTASLMIEFVELDLI